MNRRQFIQSLSLLGAGAIVGTAIKPAAGAKLTGTVKTMDILVLTGSPRKNGNSNFLAEEFLRGAQEAGHRTFRFDAAEANVHPCIACNACGMDGPCVFKDDFETVRSKLIPADMVVFATPMYYFGLSAQLKAVIDRFYAINGKIHVPKKAALLMTYANTAASHAQPIASHYDTLLDYLGWSDAGRVIAPGVWTAGSIKSTRYPQMAYELGKNAG